MYAIKKFSFVIIFSFLLAFKPYQKKTDSYSKNMPQKNLEILNKKICSTEKTIFNNVHPDEFPSDYSRQRDQNVEIPINYHVIYVAGDSIYMNVMVDNQPFPHCNWDIRDNDNNTFLLYPGFEFDYPGHSYSIGGILPPGNYSLFLYDEFGTGGISASVTTSSGEVLASVNMGSWDDYTFLDFTAPEGNFISGLVSTETIEQQTTVLNNVYNDFGYTFITANIDSAVNAGWYYATDSHKFETGQWENTDQYLAMAQAMTIDVAHSINYFWTGARLTSGMGVFPWSFPEDDSRHGLFCGNYTIPGGEPGLDMGITGVHEVGHYLGLYHTFENGCSAPGDEVDDTPNQIEPNYSCPTSNYSCGSYDDIGNYMDYMDDECLTHFTQGQKDRIDWAIEIYRPILLENTIEDYTGPVWHIATTGSDENGDGSEENPFATIQKGIDEAADGDTVLVTSGTYYENIVWPEMDGISLIGSDEADCIIDGSDTARVIDMWGSTFISELTVIENFIIQNGNAEGWMGGGGLRIHSNNPTIRNLIIRDNEAQSTGAGILCYNCSATFSNIQLEDNFSNGFGGGVYIEAAQPIFTNVNFINNSANTGGGIYCSGWESLATFISCSFINNSAYDSGAIYVTGSSQVLIEETSIISNAATSSGNFLKSGGIMIPNGSATIIGTIVWDNTPYNLQFNEAGPDSFFISYSNIQGGLNEIEIQDNSQYVEWAETNIDLPPIFCNPDSGDYTLAENSPCVGTGENGANMGAFGVGCEALQTDLGINTPNHFKLHQNYPNPFNPTTTLRYDLPEDANVNIIIYDMMGRVVSNLARSKQNAGYKSIQWNATNNQDQPVSAGVYLYSIEAGKFRQTKKMILLK